MNTPLEDEVHDALHRRADPVQRAPFTITDVRTRARRIQRRRAMAAGAAVAAVIAIAVPFGVSMVGDPRSSEIPPATQVPAPTVTDTVRIDPRSAEVVDATTVPLIDVDGPTYITADGSTPLPKVYDSLTPFDDGWIGVANDEGALTVEILGSDFAVVDGVGIPTGGVVVSPDGARLAWSEYDGTRWRVFTADVASGARETYLEFPPSPQAHEVAPVGFVSGTDVAVTQNHGEGTLSTFIADENGDPSALPGPITARAASAASGLVAGYTYSDVAGSCFAVVDGRAPTGQVAWETCDYALWSFSPDGRYVVGLAPSGDSPEGSPTLAIIDTTTWKPVVDFEVVGPRNQVLGINERVAWDGSDALVARVATGEDNYMIRLGIDGSVRRVGVTPAGLSGLQVAETR